MAKNKITLRIKKNIIFIIISLIVSCNSDINNTYYQYYIGTIRIDNPILIEFSNNDTAYVCPDSALNYINDTNWFSRADVFPYLLVAENNFTYFPIININKFELLQKGYYPYYRCKEQTIVNAKISINRFHYNINRFECYMQATNGYWYDCSDPFFLNPYADCFNCFTYDKNYRMVVKHKYNFYQILKLKYKYKHYFAQD